MSAISASSPAGDSLPVGRDLTSVGLVLLLVAVAGWSILNSVPLQSANDRSRWCTVWSLVERGTYQIDEIDTDSRWHTIDKVRFRHSESEPWHFYSSKPPLFSTMVAGVYWLQKQLTGDDLLSTPGLVSRRILLIVNLLPWALALFSFRRTLRLLQVQGIALWLLLVIAGLCTMLNPYLNTLNNHTPAAVCLIFCLSAMVRIRMATAPAGRDFAIVGVTAALTTCFELPAALFGILSFVFVVTTDVRRTLTHYVPAALLPLIAFFVTNYIVTGGIKPFYAYYGKEPYVYVHEGVPSYWSSPRGIDANTESPLIYFVHCTVGHHGLLSLTPVFVLSLLGWLGWGQSESSRSYRVVRWMGAFLACAVLAFYLTRTQNYNYGGNSAALRWMLWLGPFFWYAMIAPVQRLTQSRVGTLCVLVLSAAAGYSSVEARANPWKPGWLYRRMETAGWIDYSTKVRPFDPSRFSVLSLVEEDSTGIWKATTGQTLRLQSSSAVRIDQAVMIPLQVTLTSAEGDQQQAAVVVLQEPFESGQRPERWLAARPSSWPDGPISADESELSLPRKAAPKWVTTLLRGLPSSRPFNAEGPIHFRYLKSDGSRWAIETQRGAARVKLTADDSTDDLATYQRCDVRYAKEMPFGVVTWLIRTQDASSRTLTSVRWTASELPQ
ncbi:MAG: hypothetical protein NXI04_28545 [Planctomycetaceae bacterium]|nr:hypothetical protein [Planctomycetaceae bacterium]